MKSVLLARQRIDPLMHASRTRRWRLPYLLPLTPLFVGLSHQRS